jgi:subtilisin family serine protease
VSAENVTLAPGSQKNVTVPQPIEAITRIEALTPQPQSVAMTANDDSLNVVTSDTAPPGSQAFVVYGEGCTASGCGQPLAINMTVVIRALAAPEGPLEGFTSPSPARMSTGIPVGPGAVELTDELYVTLGSPNVVGTREEAEAAASAVGGVVSGGLEDIGVYELRWTSPQNLSARTSELEALGAQVSPAMPGLTGTDRLPPGDWNDDGPQETWPFTQVHAQEAWDTSVGSDIPVGIIDGGLVYAKHEDLDVVESIGGGEAAGHATHVAGLACAEANGIGVVGMAWGCPIVSASIGDGSPTAVLQAAEEVARSGVGVANLSLGFQNGYFCHTASEQQGLIDRAGKWKAAFRHLFQGPMGSNVVWTVAAGNNCAEGVASPWGLNSDLPNVISVGATDDGGELASFSDFGPGVEVAAPGGVSAGEVGIWSTWVEKCGILDLFTCGTYATDSGTSMSAPIVAGIAALVREAHPDYGAAEAATCITQTAGEETGWAEARSPHPTSRKPIVSFSPVSDRLPIVNADAAVACSSFNSEDAGSYVGSWTGSSWILSVFDESAEILSGINQSDTDFVNGCIAGPGLQIMTDMASTGTGQWDGLVVSVDSTCTQYSYISPMALRAIRLDDGEIALELAWPQEVDGTLPEIEEDGAVFSASPYFSEWLYRPTSPALAQRTSKRVPNKPGKFSAVPLPAG